jgi:hypothetical protein
MKIKFGILEGFRWEVRNVSHLGASFIYSFQMVTVRECGQILIPDQMSMLSTLQLHRIGNQSISFAGVPVEAGTR